MAQTKRKRKKRKSKDEIKNELIRSLAEDEVVENEELDKRTNNGNNYE